LAYDKYDPKYIPLLESAGRLPLIKDYARLELFASTVTGPNGVTKSFPDLFTIAGPDGKLGHTINKVKIIAGRVSNNDHPDEAMMSPIEAQHFGAHIGSVFTLNLYTLHVKRTVRLVGIGLFGGQVDPTAGGYLPLLLLTRAFYEQNAQPGAFSDPGTIVVTLHGGRSSIPALQEEVPKVDPHLNVTAAVIPQDAAVKRTARFQEVGLCFRRTCRVDDPGHLRAAARAPDLHGVGGAKCASSAWDDANADGSARLRPRGGRRYRGGFDSSDRLDRALAIVPD